MKRTLEEIMETFKDFTDEYRLLLLLNRTEKDGHDYNGFSDVNIVRRITTNTEEFRKSLSELLELQKTRKDSRIYSCVNPRNIDKVVYEFKYIQLKTDYMSDDSISNFYLNIQDRFLDTFTSLTCANGISYLVDIDTKDEKEINRCEETMSSVSEIILKYETPNGWHFIVKQFNPALRNGFKIKYDAFLLLNY